MANLSNISNSFIVTDGLTGRVIIGATTAVSGSTLTVGGKATFAGNVGIVGSQDSSVELQVNASSGYAETRLVGASGSGGTLEFYNDTTKLADIYADPAKNLYFRTDGQTTALTLEADGDGIFRGSVTCDEALQISSTTAQYAYQNFGASAGYGWQLGKAPATGGVVDDQGFYLYNLNTGYQGVNLAVLKSGNVGIGTTEPGNRLVVRGPSSDATGGDNNVAQFEGPSGTNGFQVYVNDTLNNTGIQTKNGDSFIINPGGGNVGIGTTSPNQKLTIGFADSGTDGISFRSATYASLAKILCQNDSSSTNGNLQFLTRSSGDVLERMRIWSAGMIQIGSDATATPELLTLQAYTQNQAFSGKYSAAGYLWFLRNETGPSGRFQLMNAGSTTINLEGNTTRDNYILGNVGIGVTSPGKPLNVVSAYSAGTVTTSLKLATLGGYNGGSGTALEFGQDQGNYATWVSGKISSPRTGDNYGGSLTFSTNRNLSPTGIEEAMRIDNLGNVGIGTTYTQFAKLTVSASDRGNGIETQVTTGGGLQYILAYSRTVGATGYLDLALAAKTLNLQTGNGTTKLSISSSGTVTLAGDKTINTSSSLRLNAGGGTLFLDSTTNIILRTGGTTPALTLDSSQRATFAGSILFDGNTAYVQDYAIRKGSDALIFSTGTGGYYFNGTGNGATFFRITGTGTIFMSALGGYPGSNADVRYDTSSKELYYQTSSKRYKTNIVNLESSLDKINLLRPVRYKDINTKKPACGLIAEETVKVIPEVVFTKEIEGFDEPQIEGINYTDLVPFLIKSIQELEARIKILEK